MADDQLPSEYIPGEIPPEPNVPDASNITVTPCHSPFKHPSFLPNESNHSSQLTPQHLPASAPPVPPVNLPRPFKHLIFTYGTLKRNMRNHYRMKKPGIAFAFNAKTVDRFPLFLDPENRHRPSLIDAKGIGHQVLGEVYAVNDQELRFMDQFERVPEHYQRHLFPIQPIFDSHFDKKIALHLFTNSNQANKDSTSSSTNDHIILAHIYCQPINTTMKMKFVEHLISKTIHLDSTDLFSSTIKSLPSPSSMNIASLPPAIQCYGSDEDKLYTPRTLENPMESFNEETPPKLQHLSYFFR